MDRTEKGEEVVFYGKNDAQRNFIHIQDLAWIILRVIQTKTSGVFSCQQIYNVKYSQIALAAIVAFNSSSVIRFDHTKPDILDNVFPIDDSLYKAIGYYPSISIDEGVKGIAKSNTKHL